MFWEHQASKEPNPFLVKKSAIQTVKMLKQWISNQHLEWKLARKNSHLGFCEGMGMGEEILILQGFPSL